MDSAQKTMARMFNRHDKQVADFETLPAAEKRYIAEKCPGFYAPTMDDDELQEQGAIIGKGLRDLANRGDKS